MRGEREAIGRIVLERFRVFRSRTELEIGRLTLFAGGNSSGKSSAMLPVLLLKQTLDAPFDPGPLLLTGGHTAIDSFEGLVTKGESGELTLGIGTTTRKAIEVSFRKEKGEISVVAMSWHGARGRTFKITPERKWRGRSVDRRRFLLGTKYPRTGEFVVSAVAATAAQVLDHVLHVPGLRSPPQRDYPVAAVGDTFAGRFDPYVASILLEWQRAGDARASAVASDLSSLGLTWKVQAERMSDTHVAIKVGRLPRARRGGAHDVVDIADVGVGVSQALPVVVALRQASFGQLVYLEQPELHLHPDAQRAMARILVDAAVRGIRVVAETHSSILLLGVQEAIARGVRGLAPTDVQLHWFARDVDTGDAVVTSRTLDAKGAFHDWPADFDSVELAAQAAYLDAVEARQ